MNGKFSRRDKSKHKNINNGSEEPWWLNHCCKLLPEFEENEAFHPCLQSVLHTGAGVNIYLNWGSTCLRSSSLEAEPKAGILVSVICCGESPPGRGQGKVGGSSGASSPTVCKSPSLMQGKQPLPYVHSPLAEFWSGKAPVLQRSDTVVSVIAHTPQQAKCVQTFCVLMSTSRF